MRRSLTNSELWIIEAELDQLPEKFPGIAFLLELKRKQFYDRNKGSLHILHKKMHEIQKNFIVHDGKNRPQKIKVEESDKEEWMFLESAIGPTGQLLTGEALSKEYYDQAEEFLQRTVTVDL